MDAITPKVTEGPLPASRKVYVKGNLHGDIAVPLREIDLHPTAGEPPVTVYDSSGPYTDPDVPIDISAGLPRLRASWIEARGDVEAYDGRHVKPEDNGFVSGEKLTPEFPIRNRPLRAKDGKAVDPARLCPGGHRDAGDGVHRHPRESRPRRNEGPRRTGR